MSAIASERMTIGEVARRTGVSIKALRFYDELGILEAKRSRLRALMAGDTDRIVGPCGEGTCATAST